MKQNAPISLCCTFVQNPMSAIKMTRLKRPGIFGQPPSIAVASGTLCSRVSHRSLCRLEGMVLRALGAFVVLAIVSAASGTSHDDVPPVIELAGRFGALEGSGQGTAVAVDAEGAAYVAGVTRMSLTGDSGAQAFVAKFAPDGTLLYELYFGGSQWDLANSIAVDALGQAWVCGYSQGADIPGMTGPANGSAFVAKVAADGSQLLFVRALGPGVATGIALDGAGDAVACGWTGGPFETTEGSFQESLAGGGDAFVAKVAGDGSAVRWATLLGGAANDYAHAVAVDASGSVYVGGETESDPFPLPPGFTPRAGLDYSTADAFLVKLSPDGSTIVHMRRIESDGRDEVAAVAVDAAGAAFLAGTTDGPDFPVTGVPVGAAAVLGRSSFAMKVQPSGGAVDYAVLLPGGDTLAEGLALGPDGSAYVAGGHLSRAGDSWRPQSAIQWLTSGGGWDSFVARLSPDASRITHATVVGGSGLDRATSIAFAPGGTVVATGVTDGNAPFDRDLGGATGGGSSALLLRLAPQDTWLSVGRAFASDGRGGRDALSFVGTHGFRDHGGFDPSAVDVVVTVTAGLNRRSRCIGAGDPGWRARSDGGWQWTSSPPDTQSRWTVVFGGGDGFRVRVDHAGFAYPVDHRFTLDMEVGAHRASYARTWKRVKIRPERWQPRLK